MGTAPVCVPSAGQPRLLVTRSRRRSIPLHPAGVRSYCIRGCRASAPYGAFLSPPAQSVRNAGVNFHFRIGTGPRRRRGCLPPTPSTAPRVPRNAWRTRSKPVGPAIRARRRLAKPGRSALRLRNRRRQGGLVRGSRRQVVCWPTARADISGRGAQQHGLHRRGDWMRVAPVTGAARGAVSSQLMVKGAVR
jgi:hypothetical protein